MKANGVKTLLWSIGVTLVLTVVLTTITKALFYSGIFRVVTVNSILVSLNYYIGYPAVYVLFTLPLFLLVYGCFYYRERNSQYHQYLMEISEDVQRIADGFFDYKVRLKSIPELGPLSANINRLVERLKLSLVEERKSEQAKNELITNVSHDLRTPLTSITGYLGLVEQDRYRDEVELRYYVSMAYEESQRLSQLVQDLFEYTRLRNNEMKLHLSKINLIEMLRQIMEQFRPQLQEAHMLPRLVFEHPQLMLMADGNKLRRVFENVFSNSIKYGHQGKYLDISGRRENREIVVEITNYGEAIPQGDLPFIFERLFRVDKSRSQHIGGSGIGLAIAKQITELHGGAIEAFSDMDQTTFIVRLKAAET